MATNPHYRHTPMSPVGRSATPAGTHNQTTLNTGVTAGPFAGTSVAGINYGSATGVNYYYSTSATGPFLKLNASPQPIATVPTVPWIITSVPPATFGKAPGTNSGGILPPNFVVGASQAGGTVPTGTYYVTATFVTAMGETTIGNVATVNVTGPQEIVIAVGTSQPTVIATLELDVPRLEDWHVTRYAILASSDVSEPTCTVYVDSIDPIHLLDSTALGSRNSANSDLDLRPGQKMIAVWTFLDAGASVTFSVYGTKLS